MCVQRLLRQFVENPPNKRIPQQLWDMVDKLLLEKIPIAGISVERTFAWLVRSPPLSKDYERKPTSSKAQVYSESSRFLLRQICNNQTPYKMIVG